MGFFEDIARSSFKVGENDENIYLSKGMFRRLYVVNDPERSQQLLSYDRKVFKLLIPIIALVILFTNIKEPITLIPIIVLVIIEFGFKKFLLRGLPLYKGEIKNIKKENTEKEVFYPSLIMVMGGIGLLFLILGLVFMFVGEGSGFGIAFFPLMLGLVITGVSLYMLKA